MKNRTKFAALAIALMASSAMALVPEAQAPHDTAQAMFGYVIGLTPSDFPSLGNYLTATMPWPSGVHTPFTSVISSL